MYLKNAREPFLNGVASPFQVLIQFEISLVF
jgi:hypothetical protein